MPTLPAAVAPWHDFFSLIGTASATLIGLLFVAASVGSGIFSSDRPLAVRTFLSSSVVHFGCVLAACLVAVAPIRAWHTLGLLVGPEGAFGLIYAVNVWRAIMRDGMGARLDLADRMWYARLPAFGYAILTAAGASFYLRREDSCAVLAVAVGVLMVAGIRNAWDITIWAVTRPRQ
jgi:hypothetical protein